MPKKVWWLSWCLLISLPMAWADFSSTLGSVWNRIISIGRLDYFGLSDGTAVVAVTRILIWILVFTVFFGVMETFSRPTGGRGGWFSFLNRGQAGVVAAVIATISAIFLPAQVLLATGAGWATAIALVLIGLPVAGVAYLLWEIPFNDQPETRGTIFLKLILCCLLFWILSAMKYHVARLGGGW